MSLTEESVDFVVIKGNFVDFVFCLMKVLMNVYCTVMYSVILNMFYFKFVCPYHEMARRYRFTRLSVLVMVSWSFMEI